MQAEEKILGATIPWLHRERAKFYAKNTRRRAHPTAMPRQKMGPACDLLQECKYFALANYAKALDYVHRSSSLPALNLLLEAANSSNPVQANDNHRDTRGYRRHHGRIARLRNRNTLAATMSYVAAARNKAQQSHDGKS